MSSIRRPVVSCRAKSLANIVTRPQPPHCNANGSNYGPGWLGVSGTFLVLGMAAFITWQSHQSAHEDQLSVADRFVTNTNQSAKNEPAIASAPMPFAPTAEAPTAKPTPARVPGAEVASSIDAESQPPPAAVPPRTAPTPTRSASRTSESEVTKTKTFDKAAVLADASARRSDTTAPPASSPGQKLPGTRSEPSALSAAAAPVATVPITATPGAPDRGRAMALAEPSPASQAYMFYNQVQTPPVTNTLVAFTVEQNGTELKMVDADGSVYTGSGFGGGHVARASVQSGAVAAVRRGGRRRQPGASFADARSVSVPVHESKRAQFQGGGHQPQPDSRTWFSRAISFPRTRPPTPR